MLADHPKKLTVAILFALVLGIIAGLLLQMLPLPAWIKGVVVNDGLDLVGQWFIRAIRMLVVPVVLVSLVCGVAGLPSSMQLGRVGAQAMLLYIATTVVAITLAIVLAHIAHIGVNLPMSLKSESTIMPPSSGLSILRSIVPVNIFSALAKGNMLAVIFIALLLGCAISALGEQGKGIRSAFETANKLVAHIMNLVISTAPIGIFCLLAVLFSHTPWQSLAGLVGYALTVVMALLLQLFLVYALLLAVFTRHTIVNFLREMKDAMLFAFSVSSSNASIPVMLATVKERLKVREGIAALVIPLGATINMDGTAIMQGVATVFIAHAYHIPLGVTQYLTVIGMATLASVGTAGVPSVGLITLSMVLEEVGLPVSGIALIIGIDRLLDMARTVINVTGDAVIATCCEQLACRRERRLALNSESDDTQSS